MVALRQLQEALRDVSYGDDMAKAAVLIKEDGISKADRLSIYRENVQISLRKNLEEKYGVVRHIVDPRFFAYAASEYIKQYVSHSGNLEDYGEHMAEFLAGFEPCKEYGYLPDIARLEWARHVAYLAEDAEVLQRDKYENGMEIRCIDSLRLISSDFPIDKIWRVSQKDYDGDEAVDMAAGGVHMIVLRPEYRIDMHVVSEAEAELLRRLMAEDYIADNDAMRRLLELGAFRAKE